MRVVVVEDEAFLAELIRLALEADGHECRTTHSLSMVSHFLRTSHVDVLTLDLVLDEQDPLDWLEETVLAYPALHGRIFILTGRLLEHAESVRVRGCGARIMQKPFTLQQLRETVRLMTPLGRTQTGGAGRPPVVET